MRKFLYIMPAVLICMLYALLAALAGGIGGFQPIAFAYIGLPVLAGLVLRKEKWWGCFFGIAMGTMLVYTSMRAEPQIMAGFAAGLILAAYYAAMGILCAASLRKNVSQ